MRKRKYRKFTTNVELKRKFILNMIVFSVCVIGIGYAYVNTALEMQGNIALKKINVTASMLTYENSQNTACTNSQCALDELFGLLN